MVDCLQALSVPLGSSICKKKLDKLQYDIFITESPEYTQRETNEENGVTEATNSTVNNTTQTQTNSTSTTVTT